MMISEDIFPRHKCGLYLSHNEYRDCYETAEEWLREYRDDVVSDDEYQLCIQTGEIWKLQWYPKTPIGSCSVIASTLEKVLEAAREDGE